MSNKRLTRTLICRAYGVPPWVVGFTPRPGIIGRAWWHVGQGAFLIRRRLRAVFGGTTQP